MTKDVSPVNIWRAWDESEGAVCLVATYDPDSGLYTRRLNAHDSKLLGEAEVVGKYHELFAFTLKHLNQCVPASGDALWIRHGSGRAIDGR